MKKFSRNFKSFGSWRKNRGLTHYAKRVIRLHDLYPKLPLRQLRGLRRPIMEPDYSVLEWARLSSESKTSRVKALSILDEMRDGVSFSEACENYGLDSRTAIRHIKSALSKIRGRWVANEFDFIERAMNIYENGSIKSIVIDDSRYASIIGKYYNDVKKALETGDESVLRKYKKIVIRDVDGKKHKLETRLDKIRDIEEAKEEPEFYQIYSV